MNATAPPNTRAQLLLALSQNNWDQLDELMDDLADAMGDQEAQEYLRNSVLPNSSAATVEAFWRYVMTDDQFNELVENLAMATTHRLDAEGCRMGSDYSYNLRADGSRQLLLSESALALVKTFYSPARFSTLRILLR